MLADTVYYARNIYEMALAAGSLAPSPVQLLSGGRPKVSCGLRWEWHGEREKEGERKEKGQEMAMAQVPFEVASPLLSLNSQDI